MTRTLLLAALIALLTRPAAAACNDPGEPPCATGNALGAAANVTISGLAFGANKISDGANQTVPSPTGDPTTAQMGQMSKLKATLGVGKGLPKDPSEDLSRTPSTLKPGNMRTGGPPTGAPETQTQSDDGGAIESFKIHQDDWSKGPSDHEAQIATLANQDGQRIAEDQNELARLTSQSAAAEARGTPVPPATQVKTGDIYTRLGEPAKAEKSYRDALGVQPQNPQALAGLSVSLAQQGRQDEARQAAVQALAVDPQNATAKLVIGHADSLARGDALSKKLSKLDLGKTADPGALGGMAGPGLAGARPPTGGAPKAPPVYDLAKPLSPAQQLVLGALRKHDIGDDQGALLALTQAMDQDPRDAGAFVVRAEVDNSVRNFPAAIQDATHAVELAPGKPVLDARALRARSYARFETGDYASALADAASATQLDSKSGLGYLYKAMAEEKLGLKGDAARDLAQAVSLDPALAALAGPLMSKLGLAAPASAASRRDPRLMRGGLIAASLLLVVLGLAGTRAGRKLTTTAARGAFSDAARTLAPASAGEIAAGSRIGSYRVVREIGRGGMGVVYEALDETLQRRVAIKRMQAGEGADLERFLREARLVAQLKHPHLAEIYNVVVEGEPFLVFEFVEGRGLDAALRAAGTLPVPQVRRVVSEVCEALEYAHARNIIHRDLKPANVMLTADGSCKIMDFGIAHQSRGASTMTQTAVCGTPSYMAPEQGFGSVTKSSDFYALGVMAYELLTGARPFDGGDLVSDKLNGRFLSLAQRAPALPKSLDAFFARALAPDAAQRFSSAAEFRAAFEAALESTPQPARA